MFLDNLRINNQSIYNVQAEIQDSVDCKESLRNAQTFICRVIQSSFKPLSCGCDCRIKSIYHYISGKGGNTLTSHRISLISHCGRSNLRFLKWFLYFFQMLKETDIVGHLVRTCCDSCKNISNTCVYFTGISLSGYRIAFLESHFLCDHWIDLINGLLISVKQLQEAGLCSGCSLGSKKLHCSKNIFQIFQIKQEFLCPECCTFTNCSRLCRLEMCERQSRLFFIFISESRKFSNDIDQFLAYKLQRFCHYNNICIITYITGGCSQMDDPFCFRTLYTVCVYMRHNIVTYLTFTFFGNVIVDILCMCLQFIDLLLCNVKAKLFICLCKCDPEFSPCTEFHIRRKNILHFFAGITF